MKCPELTIGEGGEAVTWMAPGSMVDAVTAGVVMMRIGAAGSVLDMVDYLYDLAAPYMESEGASYARIDVPDGGWGEVRLVDGVVTGGFGQFNNATGGADE